MNRLGFQLLLAGSLLASDHASFAVTLTIDFEELPLESEDFYNGSDLAGGFASFGAQFNNLYTEFGGGCCWNGWSYSRTTDTTIPDPSNQYSAFPGSGAEGSLQYGVAFSGFDAGGGIIPEITLPAVAEPTSVKVTNTTYAALSMKFGDAFAKKFGGASGDDPDWFLLKVEGLDASDVVVGDVSMYLADYRFANQAEDFIVDEWTELDLTPLSGLGVRKLAFRLTSTDNGNFGMNTPAYVAIDNLVLDVTTTPGDFDLNGIVDHLDLEIWEQHYGTALGAGVTTGDADGDGDVDGVDLLAWQLNFSPPQPLSVAVPEPSAALMILSWSIFFCCSRHNFSFVDDTLQMKGKS
ncbi:MAG: DUF4465 domain-containing protein [Planctomycetes bacterium]|nr:DUF4465 domain-containing protein [Planctomycetota bacterium]